MPRFGRIPYIYINSRLYLECDNSSLENTDVLYFDQAGADHFLCTNPSLKGKVLVIRDKSSTVSFQSLVLYHSRWPDTLNCFFLLFILNSTSSFPGFTKSRVL